MKRFSAMTYAKAAWIFCMVAALVVELAFPSPVSWCPVGEPGFYATIVSTALTFPACVLALVVLFVTGVVAVLAEARPLPEVVNGFIIWLAMFAAGWWQWFIAAPWLWRKWKAWKVQRAEAQP